MSKIGIYLGYNSESVSNINDVLEVWVQSLSKAGHEVDLIGGDNIPKPTQEIATVQRVQEGQSPTPIGRIKDA